MINIQKLESMIHSRMENAQVPGVALAIIKGNETLYESGFGVTSVEDGGVSITPNTLFCIGSLTKPLTGTLLMKLVEENLIEIDRPIVDYVPWFQLNNKTYSRMVTLRMLLSHTAGIPHVFEKYGSLESDALEKLVRNLSTESFLFEPGRTWSYSDVGIDVAGYLAEVVTGKTFQELMQEFVFGPLEMNQTTFDPLVAMTYPLALAHETKNDGTLGVIHRFVGNAAQNPSSFAMTSVRDMTRFMKGYTQAGKTEREQFIKILTIEAMHTIIGDYFKLNQSGYGLTFEIEMYNGFKRVWHDGSIQSYASWMFIAPEQEVGVVLMTNKSQGFWGAAEEIINHIFDEVLGCSIENDKPVYMGKHIELTKVVGTYTGSWLGIVRIFEENDSLAVEINGEKQELKAFGYDRFTGEDMTVGIVNTELEKYTDIMVNGIPCEKVSEDPNFTYHKTDFTAYLGSFAEGNDLLRFYVKNDALYCFDQYDDKDYVCKMISSTKVVIPHCLIDFIKNNTEDFIAVRINNGKVLKKITHASN